MFMQVVAIRAASSRARAFRGCKRVGNGQACLPRAAMGLAVGLLLGGCVTTALPLAKDPADPGVKVAGVGYRSTTASYVSLRPASPDGWQDQNRRVTPPPTNER
jgi:hypothetical protein